MLKVYIYYICKYFFSVSERTFMKQIVTFQDSNYKVANFWWGQSESQQTLKIRDKEISPLLIFSFYINSYMWQGNISISTY